MNEPPVFQFSNADVARGYERYLVPRLFAPWAEALLEAVDLRPGEEVLDVACGPGTVSEAAARRVGASGRVAGTDASEEMLAVARARGTTGVRYERAPADALPFADESFDLVTCQQGLQFFPDRAAALREMFRVLRPGGRAGISAWTSLADAPYFGVVRDAVGSMLPEVGAAMGKPFSYPDAKTLGREVEAAGFDVVVDAFSLPLEFEGGLEEAVEAMQGTPVWPAVAAQPGRVRSAVLDAAREGFARFLHHGRVRTSMRSNVAVARRPA